VAAQELLIKGLTEVIQILFILLVAVAVQVRLDKTQEVVLVQKAVTEALVLPQA
jgi:hypothetical protein